MNLEIQGDSTSPTVEVSIQDPQWEQLQGNINKIINATITTTLSQAILPREALDKALEISIVLANDDLVHILNREYRDKDKPTNVLTFATLDSDEPITEGPLNLGDVILAYETVRVEATDQGKFILDHLKHLIVHGVLHLLGYDHQTEEEATDMETLEIRILERLGVQNPYIDGTDVI